MNFVYRVAHYALLIVAVPLMWSGTLLAYWSEICAAKGQFPQAGRASNQQTTKTFL